MRLSRFVVQVALVVSVMLIAVSLPAVAAEHGKIVIPLVVSDSVPNTSELAPTTSLADLIGLPKAKPVYDEQQFVAPDGGVVTATTIYKRQFFPGSSQVTKKEATKCPNGHILSTKWYVDISQVPGIPHDANGDPMVTKIGIYGNGVANMKIDTMPPTFVVVWYTVFIQNRNLGTMIQPFIQDYEIALKTDPPGGYFSVPGGVFTTYLGLTDEQRTWHCIFAQIRVVYVEIAW